MHCYCVRTHAAEVAETVGVVVSEEPLLLPAHEGHHFCKISQKAASCYRKEMKKHNSRFVSITLMGLLAMKPRCTQKQRRNDKFCRVLPFVSCTTRCRVTDNRSCWGKFRACAHVITKWLIRHFGLVRSLTFKPDLSEL